MRKILFALLCFVALQADAQYFQRYFNLSVTVPPYRDEQFFSGIKTNFNYNLTPSSHYYAGIGVSYFGQPVAVTSAHRLRFVRTTNLGVANQNYGWQFADGTTPLIYHNAGGRSICEIGDTLATPGYMFCGGIGDNLNSGSTNVGGGDALIGRISSTAGISSSYKLDFGGREVATCIRRSVFLPGTYIVCGYSQRTNTPGTAAVNECWVARVNKTGGILWACRYNFDPTMINNVLSADQRANSLCENPTTGEIFVVGSILDQSALAPTTDGLIFKLTPAGAMLCQSSWHVGLDDQFQSIKYTTDNNLIIGGFTDGGGPIAIGFYNMWLIKFNQFCFPLWNRLEIVNNNGAIIQSKCYDVIERINTANAAEFYLTGPSYPTTGPRTHIYKTDAAGTGLNHWSYAALSYDNGFGIDYANNGAPFPGPIVFSNTNGVLSPGFADSYLLKTYFNGCTCTNYCPNNPPQNLNPQMNFKQIPFAQNCQFVKTKLVNVRYNYARGSICNQAAIGGGSNAKLTSEFEDGENSGIQLYPSPAVDNLIIENNSELEITGTYMVIDMQGKVVMRGNINLTEDDNTTMLNIANLQTGVYSLVINDANTITRKSFIKQ